MDAKIRYCVFVAFDDPDSITVVFHLSSLKIVEAIVREHDELFRFNAILLQILPHAHGLSATTTARLKLCDVFQSFGGVHLGVMNFGVPAQDMDSILVLGLHDALDL